MKAIFTLVFLPIFFFADAQSSSYKKLISGTGNTLFRGIVLKSADGGYVTTGDVELYELGEKNNFISIVKRDSKGKYQWRYRIDAPYSYTDFLPTMLLETPDHGFLLGILEDKHNDYGTLKGYHYIIKLDTNGKMIWSKQVKIGDYPFIGGYNTVFGIVTRDSNYLITACRAFENDFHGLIDQNVLYALKINDNGEVMWIREYFIEGGDWQPTGIIENSDKTFTIGLQGGLFNINEKGDFLSGKLYKKSGFPLGFSTITGNSNSGFYLTGENNILALNEQQQPAWAKLLLNNGYTNDNSAYLWYKSGASLPDSGCLLAAEIKSSAGGTSLTRFNKNGKTIFQKRLPVISYTGQSALVKTYSGYMFYTTNWTIDEVMEFDDPNKICYSQPDDVSVVTDETALVSFEELVLETDSVGSFIDYPFQQILEASYNSVDKICSTTVLPLNILSFTASKNGASNKLEWSTSQEINTDHFKLQIIKNAIYFTDIGLIKALNNAAVRSDYNFTDSKPGNSTNYYRLMIVDKDGSSTFSTVIKVDANNNYDVTLYPNPVRQNIVLNFNAQKAQHLVLKIYNSLGKIVTTKIFDVMAGASVKEIVFNNFSKGIYFISIKTSEGEKSLKFIKE